MCKAEALAAQVGAPGLLLACGYRDLEAIGCFDLVVNATSASLTGELPPAPPTVFSPMGTAYELVYGRGAHALPAPRA